GFSPGTRTLRADLTLDPGIEAHRLPMSVRIDFRDRRGQARALESGDTAPTDGTATITLANITASPRTVALGTAAPRPLARALDTLYDAARTPRAAVPPYAGRGLPTVLPGAHWCRRRRAGRRGRRRTPRKRRCAMRHRRWCRRRPRPRVPPSTAHTCRRTPRARMCRAFVTSSPRQRRRRAPARSSRRSRER